MKRTLAYGSSSTELMEIEIELKETQPGFWVFSASGVMGSRKYPHTCGQCLNEIAEACPSNERLQRLVALWRKWHLNDMNAGFPEQHAALVHYDREKHGYDWYRWATAELKAKGLYEVPLPDGAKCTGSFPEAVLNGSRGYRFGERWVWQEIPADDLAEIRSYFA